MRGMMMPRLLRPAALALAIALPSVAMAAAEPRDMTQSEVNQTLRGTPDIYNRLYVAALVHAIARHCEALSGPGRVARTTYFLGVYNQARRIGFSRAQIEGFVENPEERARMEARVRSYVGSKGASLEDQASICALGRAEMAAGSAVGRRLFER